MPVHEIRIETRGDQGRGLDRDVGGRLVLERGGLHQVAGGVQDLAFGEGYLQRERVQEPGDGVPAYTRWVNRRGARLVAALAAHGIAVPASQANFVWLAGFGEARFVGVENYSRLADDPFFWTALRNTIVILVVAVVVVIPLSFGLALLLDRRLPAVGALRALVFAPAIIAPILVGLIWVFILDPSIGLVNRLLSLLGLPSVEWIGGDTLSPYSIAMVFIWSTVGFTMTIFYAGLQQLPHEVIEASQIDGASFWQRQRHVVIPMMRETSFSSSPTFSRSSNSCTS